MFDCVGWFRLFVLLCVLNLVSLFLVAVLCVFLVVLLFWAGGLWGGWCFDLLLFDY